MIKCTQCGNINATGAMACQSCGAPLSSMVDGGISPRTTSPGQPELPAWLESLRAGEHSSSPANSAAHFSAADFVDEDSLPSWMRAQRNEARGNTGANPSVTLRPSSMPGPTTDGDHQSGSGISARSLLDEQALPSWMREGQQSGPVSAQEKLAASNLVQAENMPDWMKSLHREQASFPGETGGGSVASSARSSQGPASTPQIPAFQPQRPAGGSAFDLQAPSSSVHPAQTGFSARDLIDPQSLPSWMSQQGGQPGQPTQSPPASQPNASRNPGQAGFSARDLIDPQSLPSWMSQQGGQPGQPTQSPPASQPSASRNPGQAAPGQTFSASSLLDTNALPDWLRQQGQGGNTQGQSGSPADHSFAATPPPSSTFGGNIPASSLIDPNSAPEWMRLADPQQQKMGVGVPPQSELAQPYIPSTPQPHTYAGPPRVENVRVPNRPRHAINPNENSEVAANVFSSMLGVASSTPNYPTSLPQPQSSYQGIPENPAQPNMGYPTSQSAMPPSSSANYAGAGMGAIPNTPSMAPNMPQGYTPGKGYGSSYQSSMSSSQMGNSYSANMPYTSNSFGNTSGQKAEDMANEQKKTKKRGLFGAILEWLTH